MEIIPTIHAQVLMILPFKPNATFLPTFVTLRLWLLHGSHGSHNMCISKQSSELICSTFSWFFHSNEMLPSFHICHTENFESCMNLMDLITCVYSNDPQNWLNYHTQYIPIQNWNLYPYLIPLFHPSTLPLWPLNCHCIHLHLWLNPIILSQSLTHLSLSVWTSVLMYHPRCNY